MNIEKRVNQLNTFVKSWKRKYNVVETKQPIYVCGEWQEVQVWYLFKEHEKYEELIATCHSELQCYDLLSELIKVYEYGLTDGASDN